MVVHQFFWFEPQSDFFFSRIDSIRSVANISTDIDAEVASDGAWGRSKWVGGAEHGSSLFDSVFALPNHAADRARVHVFDEASKEWLAR